jgi:hypothetical protein
MTKEQKNKIIERCNAMDTAHTMFYSHAMRLKKYQVPKWILQRMRFMKDQANLIRDIVINSK